MPTYTDKVTFTDGVASGASFGIVFLPAGYDPEEGSPLAQLDIPYTGSLRQVNYPYPVPSPSMSDLLDWFETALIAFADQYLLNFPSGSTYTITRSYIGASSTTL